MRGLFLSVAVFVGAGLILSYVKAGSSASSTLQDCTVVVKIVSELRSALTSAQKNNMNDVICIQAGTYKVTQPLTYYTEDGDDGHSLTIKAIGGQVVLDGDSKTQIMIIDTDTDNNGKGDRGGVTIEGITFQRGLASKHGGGLYIKTGSARITLINNTFNANQAHSGAGVYLYSYTGTIYIANNVFYGNSATHYGGGVYAYSSEDSIRLINNTFVSNNAFEY
ncbi:MAG: hypothetical protein NZ526_04435 [Aquificaceae bacterium]|nr:hypothetical protein [Aquificaceae bacterium]